MVAAAMRATAVLDRRDALGESPMYDVATGRVLWVDVEGPFVHELLPGDDGAWRAGRSWTMPGKACAVVPRIGDGVLVIVGLDVCVLDDDGGLETLVSVDTGGVTARFNDCKVDPRGRLVGGWVASDFTPRGEVVRIDPDGSVTTLFGGVSLSNGLDWSPDGATFYFIDTPLGGIDAFDYDLDAGTVSNRRRIVTIPRGEGVPDGMCVDDEGCLWTAALFGSEIRRYAPDGEPLGAIEASAHYVSSCAFGGPDRDELFITTIGMSMPAVMSEPWGIATELHAACEANPDNGLLYTCRPGVTGPPATPFGGSR
jgi:sugar lactone lactonase YvrE